MPGGLLKNIAADPAAQQNFEEISRWVHVGSGDPEGVITAQLGRLFIDRSTGDLYRKASDDGLPTGWVSV